MNSVVHFEIPVDDRERAKKFYSETFGWGMTDPMEEYTIVETTELDEQRMPKKPGALTGGLGPRRGNLMHPTVTIAVDDIDAALDKIEATGGERLGDKMEVTDMGWSAYFKDTEGNVIGLWQNKK